MRVDFVGINGPAAAPSPLVLKLTDTAGNLIGEFTTSNVDAGTPVAFYAVKNPSVGGGHEAASRTMDELFESREMESVRRATNVHGR